MIDTTEVVGAATYILIELKRSDSGQVGEAFRNMKNVLELALHKLDNSWDY